MGATAADRPRRRWREAAARAHVLLTRDIWRASSLDDHTWRGEAFRVLRILSITARGVIQSGLAARAGALSFGSLLALGPLLVIAVAVSGFILGGREDLVVSRVNDLIGFIAPHVRTYSAVEETARTSTGEAGSSALNPQLVEVLNGIISSSRSGAVGVVGFLAFLVVVINLFTSVETTFNAIWGVERGRSWSTRIVLYWTVLTLGTLLAFAALSIVSAGAIATLFGAFNLEAQARALLSWSAPLLSFLLLVGVLSAFYKFIPNAPVRWKAATAGGAVVALLLLANHYSAFLYVNRVVMDRSLYGSLGIVFVLMAGLYIFWLFILGGGLLSYAVQNADYLCRDPAWETLSHRARETYVLLVYVRICRDFHASRPPLTVLELGEALHLPAVIVHQCLDRLRDLGLISFLEAEPKAELHDHRAQPARPLSQVTLNDFREAFERLGTAREGSSAGDLDPLVRSFYENLRDSLQKGLGTDSIESLISRTNPT